jgi:tetratricopeptide (TPR) repeat protein
MLLDFHQRAESEGLDSSYWMSWFSLAFELNWAECYEQALGAFKHVCESRNAYTDMRFASFVWRGHIFDTLGQRDKAVKEYQDALSIGMSDGGYMQHSFIDAWLDNDWARERLKTPYKRIPTEVHELCVMPIDTSEKDKALELYSKVLNYQPAHWEFWFHIGQIMWNCGYFDEALESFRRTCEWISRHQTRVGAEHANFASLACQGRILEELGRKDEAAEAYRSALKAGITQYTGHPFFDGWMTEDWVRDRLEEKG